MTPARPIPLHPLLFVLFPVVSLYVRNRAEVMWRETVGPAVLALALFAALWLLLTLLLRDRLRGGIATTIVALVTFSWAPVNALLMPRGIEPWLTAWLLVALGAAGIIVTAVTKRSLEPATRWANVAAACALLAALAPLLVGRGARSPLPAGDNFPELAEVDRAFARAAPESRPDIYYLIFDQYGSRPTLAGHFGWDNGPFIAWLRSRGFYVAEESVANYPRTAFALGANLNLHYVHRVTSRLARSETDLKPLLRYVDDHRLGRFLRSRGYRYVHMGSWWQPTAKSSIADLNINPNVVIDFSTLLLRNTIVYAFIERREEGYEMRREHWSAEREKFARLPELATGGKPLFVFAHFLVTHAPYVFSADGEFIPGEAAKAMGREQLYAAQIAWTNRELTRIIIAIQERGRASGRMPVIIVQADEGPYPSNLDNPPPSFDWRTATREEFAVKSGILNAILLPGKDAEALLWPSITPVNTFRVVSNAYFGTSFPMLPDQQFVYENEYHRRRFYRLEDGRWVADAVAGTK